MSITGGRVDFSDEVQREWRAGVLSTRPVPATKPPLPAGVQWPLGEDGPALFVPASLGEGPSLGDGLALGEGSLGEGLALGGPVPLVIVLHGAGSTPARTLPIMQSEAERRGFAVLVPKSVDYTWDIIRGGFGPDIGALDRALSLVYDHLAIDPGRVVLSGFSDGASYALSLGLINGDLFSHILAFSPGFVVPGRRHGRPTVFISHGVADTVLPIERCSRRIVPVLQRDGYDVRYREFDGGHDVPADVLTEAADLLT